MNELARSALAGAATGGRTMTGLGVLTAMTPPSAQDQPDRTLRRPAAAVPIAALMVTELVLDKLPQTPSRLGPPGLIGRGVAAAVCGVVVARRAWGRQRDGATAPAVTEPPGTGEPSAGPAPARPDTDPRMVLACVATAVTVAVGTSWLGVQCRDIASRKLGPAWVGAALEDAAVVALAVSAAR